MPDQHIQTVRLNPSRFVMYYINVYTPVSDNITAKLPEQLITQPQQVPTEEQDVLVMIQPH